ncbi:hypothetical protein Tcan_10582 [Toxocara canis]|uniref:Uncharacterized protein n=1 Tax=Toxocara canis TaxID=6265 RepID=A0A0B2UU84_TOXCA|nr:hypothetical protein Tcan_10582 [Toxocara canis]
MRLSLVAASPDREMMLWLRECTHGGRPASLMDKTAEMDIWQPLRINCMKLRQIGSTALDDLRKRTCRMMTQRASLFKNSTAIFSGIDQSQFDARWRFRCVTGIEMPAVLLKVAIPPVSARSPVINEASTDLCPFKIMSVTILKCIFDLFTYLAIYSCNVNFVQKRRRLHVRSQFSNLYVYFFFSLFQ